MKFSKWTLLKNVAVIEQPLNPTYFNEYPIDVSKTNITTFEELEPEYNIDGKFSHLNFNTSTYAYSNGVKTTNTEYFAQAFTAFNTLWKR